MKKNLLGYLGAAAFGLVLAFGLWSGTAAAADAGLQVRTDAQLAGDLGLLQGDADGISDAYLAKPTLRIQAAIVDLRLKGLEQEALAFTGTANFEDADKVGAANRPVLAYLKAHPELGWEGIGNDLFDPVSSISPQQFYKVMLGSLGYMTDADFSYDNTISFAKSKGLFRAASAHSFTNRELATSLIESMRAKLKGSGATQAAVLVQKGRINEKAASELGWQQLNLAGNAQLGKILVDGNGLTLYYFTKDSADLNSCKGKCLSVWPIYDTDQLVVPADLNSGDFGRFVRADGQTQITYKGWPVYYYAADELPGDVKGEDVGHVWFVFKDPAYSVAIGTKAGIGNYLTDAKGRTLYYFDKDVQNASSCMGTCEQLWPVFNAGGSVVVPTGLNPADFSTITRADGTLQTTYKGFPLYYFAQDSALGDTTGQGFKDVWFVVNPAEFQGTTASRHAAGS